MSDPAALLSTNDAAALLHVSPRTLQAWRGSGEGPRFVRLSANRVCYTREALAAFVAARTRQSTTDDVMPPRAPSTASQPAPAV